ncbi:MAG: Na(+)-translocating NADH-quinone reductase subunit C [Desulfobacula sp.]|nr:Na(+)-translocating NADH-quinone reductase subunit C [Desulfobacula sp.]
MSVKKETPARTILITLILCVVCSVLVSFSAVYLKPIQEKNKQLDIKKNLLMAAKLICCLNISEELVDEAYHNIEIKVVDLATGLYNETINPFNFDQAQAARNPDTSKLIDSSLDVAGIKKREKFSKIYIVKTNDRTDQVIFPIYGKGLWSTMYGFIALAPDLSTIKGITFYSHGETPGLGGEIENDSWKKLWIGKKIFDDDFKVIFDIVKGKVYQGDTNIKSKVDGISGATLTGNGVENTILYWFGMDGFLKFIKNEIKTAGKG